MRTRLIRPEFWADSRMADLSSDARLTYIGLWCLADDDGYLSWSVRDIAAELYRYDAPRQRERRVERHLSTIVDGGRVRVLECGRHAVIPSLPRHRVKGGNLSDQHHRSHTSTCLVHTSTDKYPSVSVSVSGSVTGSGSVRDPAQDDGSDDPETRRRRALAALDAVVTH
jgi:hypothetical protein